MSTNDPIFELARVLKVSAGTLGPLVVDAGLKVVFAERDRGDGRKQHYGSGKQPIDTIMENGWGAAFCAGNILKYLRRTKDRQHSIDSARVYWQWLMSLAEAEGKSGLVANHPTWVVTGAIAVATRLEGQLVAEELNLLVGNG